MADRYVAGCGIKAASLGLAKQFEREERHERGNYGYWHRPFAHEPFRAVTKAEYDSWLEASIADGGNDAVELTIDGGPAVLIEHD